MSVARLLGVDESASAPTGKAREAWRKWCAADPELAVVDELDRAAGWTRHACRAEKDAVLAGLLR